MPTGTVTPPVDLASVTVAAAMHAGVVTCAPEASLVGVARMMAGHRVHCVVVYGARAEGEESALWGIVSDLDLVGAAPDLSERTAGGVAATPLVSIGPDESLLRAAQLMAEYGTAHLVVVAPGSARPAGVLSTLDVARVIADS